jgi:hypothetical protein
MTGGGKTTTTTDSSNTSSMQYDPTLMKEWQNIIGTAGGLSDWLVNNAPPQASVAAPGDLTSQYWQNAGNPNVAGGVDVSGVMGGYGDVYNQMGGMSRDPNAINLPSNFNFQPGALQFNNPYAGGVPSVTAPGGVSGNYQDYLTPVQNVSAQQVNARDVTAPSAVDPITAAQLERVYGPQLQNYQFNPSMLQQINAPNLQNFQMKAAADIAPSGLATTQSWLAPGTASAFMDPYAQQVVDVQKQKAVQDWQQATEGQRAQASAAGAYGGSRQAVEEATGQRDLQLQLAQIQASGLQNAYQQGMQQFNTQQQQAQAAQQFNINAALSAAQANQQMQQQANVQNLSSFLQTQGLGAQTGLSAAQANQAAALNVGGQNLQALLQTQGLGAQLSQQAALANQQQTYNMATANQQAQEFSKTQQQQAALANQQANLTSQQLNQQAGLSAALANQQAGLQSGLAARQMGLTGAEFGSQQQMQAGLANQQALMAALSQQYQGGLQGAMQTQQLGMQGQIAGGQLGLQGAQAQEALRQAQQGLNLSGAAQQANVLGQMGQLNLGAYNAGLMGLAAQQQAAQGQQGYLQQGADVAYQNAMQGLMMPLQSQAYLASILGMQPQNYTTTSTGHGTQVTQLPSPNILSQILGGGLTAAGMFIPGGNAAGGIFGSLFGRGGGTAGGYPGASGLASMGAKGGLIGGLKHHEDAPQDRKQMLAILKEKGLLKRSRGGGLAAVA